MITLITGLSGSGKTTIAKCIGYALNIPVVVPSTTRQPRQGEVEGVDYQFLTKEDFFNSEMVAVFHVRCAEGEVWSYGINKEYLKNDCIAVVTPSGVRDLKCQTSYDIIDVMIDMKDELRMNRMFDRKDNQSKEEIIRRDKTDKITYSAYKPMFTVSNDGSVYNAVRTIDDIIMHQK